MLKRGRALLGRAGWSFTDQALSSLSNFGLSVLMARATGVDGYGAFAIAFTIFTFLQGISRALVNNPYLIRYGQVGDAEAKEAARGGSGLALVLGIVAAPIVVAVAFFLHGEAVPTVAAMAVLLPGLLVQDVWRSVFIARQRPQLAAASTLVWTALQFASLGAILVAGERNSAFLMAAWGVTGCISAVLAAWWGHGSPSVRGAREFARRGRDLSGYLVAEWLTLLGALQIALLVVGGIGSAADVGFLRASQTLLGPLNILVVATFSFWVPELVRRPHLSNSRLRTIAGTLSGVLAVLTLVCGVVLLSLPEHVGRAVLGDVWPGTRPTLLPTTLFMVGVALMVGPVTVIRARGVPRASFKVNLLVGALLLVCTPVGFIMGGAAGAAAGFAVANLVPVPLFWWQMEVALRQPALPTTAVTAHSDGDLA